MDNSFVLRLYSQPGTVFTTEEISQLMPNVPYKSLRDKLHYFTKKGKIKRLRYGIYAKENYDCYELANKIYVPSYISLETVFMKTGMVFQHYDTIFVVSYVTREVAVGSVNIQYRGIKNEILINMRGIKKEKNYFIASPERAFLDALYIYKDYYFDNLRSLDWDKAADLVHIYKNKMLEQRFQSYLKQYLEKYDTN